jgi:membrane protease YdiL (CAAX protease family)
MELGDSIMNYKPSWNWLDVILVYGGIIILSFLMGRYGQHLMSFLHQFGFPNVGLAYFTVAYVLQFLVTVGLVLLLVVVARRTDWRELGLKPLSARKMLRYGIVGGLALLAVIFVLSLPLEILNPDIEPQVYEEILRSAHGVSQLLLLLLMGAVLAPISEELFFRGMIYPLTRYSLGPFWGAIGAGIIFGLAHWDAWRAIPLAIGGAILCYLYEKSDSIWATVTAHGMWNGIMTLLVYFSLA